MSRQPSIDGLLGAGLLTLPGLLGAGLLTPPLGRPKVSPGSTRQSKVDGTQVGLARLSERGGAPRFPRILWAAALAAGVFCFQGCGDRDQSPELTKQAVKFDQVPALARDAAKKAIPGVDLNEAWKNLDREGKLHSYEIRGKNAGNGKIREVRVSPTGEILEQE